MKRQSWTKWQKASNPGKKGQTVKYWQINKKRPRKENQTKKIATVLDYWGFLGPRCHVCNLRRLPSAISQGRSPSTFHTSEKLLNYIKTGLTDKICVNGACNNESKNNDRDVTSFTIVTRLLAGWAAGRLNRCQIKTETNFFISLLVLSPESCWRGIQTFQWLQGGKLIASKIRARCSPDVSQRLSSTRWSSSSRQAV